MHGLTRSEINIIHLIGKFLDTVNLLNENQCY